MLDQSDQDDFGAAAKSHGWAHSPDAASHKNRAAGSADQSMKIFLAVTRRDDGGTVPGQDNLPAVGMPAQDQADAPVAYRLDEIRIV